MGKAEANSSMIGRHKKRIKVAMNNEMGELYRCMRFGRLSEAGKVILDASYSYDGG